MSKMTLCYRFYDMMLLHPGLMTKKFFSEMLKGITVKSARMILEGKGRSIRGRDRMIYKRLLKALYYTAKLNEKRHEHSTEKRNQFVLY